MYVCPSSLHKSYFEKAKQNGTLYTPKYRFFWGRRGYKIAHNELETITHEQRNSLSAHRLCCMQELNKMLFSALFVIGIYRIFDFCIFNTPSNSCISMCTEI
jgi:hypothetical protein